MRETVGVETKESLGLRMVVGIGASSLPASAPLTTMASTANSADNLIGITINQHIALEYDAHFFEER